MVWVLILAMILGVVWVNARKKKRYPSAAIDPVKTAYVVRQGRSIVADEAFEAWTSGDLEKMIQAMSCKTNPIDRHFLLMNIVKKAYTKRTDPEMAKLCGSVAHLHLTEFPQIAPVLQNEFSGELPRVSTFQNYATLLTEQGQFEKAIEVCKMALKYDLHDNTLSGFEGRIARINKKQLQARQS